MRSSKQAGWPDLWVWLRDPFFKIYSRQCLKTPDISFGPITHLHSHKHASCMHILNPDTWLKRNLSVLTIYFILNYVLWRQINFRLSLFSRHAVPGVVKQTGNKNKILSWRTPVRNWKHVHYILVGSGRRVWNVPWKAFLNI